MYLFACKHRANGRSKIATYKYRTSSSIDLLRSGRELRYLLSSSNVAWHSSVHWKFFDYLRALKNGMLFYVDLDKNLLRATIVLLRHCTSLIVCGGAISRRAQIFLSLLRSHAMMPWIQAICWRRCQKHTCWVRLHLKTLEHSKNFFEVHNVILNSFALYKHVIHLYLYISSYLFLEDLVHKPLIGCPSII